MKNSQQQFTSSSLVNEEIEIIIDLIFRDFISSWYCWISTNSDFIDFLKPEWIRMTRALEDRFKSIDYVELLCVDLPRLLDQHLTDFQVCKKKVNCGYSGGYGIEQLFLLHQPHYALNSQESEEQYLCKIVDLLLDSLLLDKAERQSALVKSVLEEILSALLLNLANLLSMPETIYDIIFNAVVGMDDEMRRKYRRIDKISTVSRDIELIKSRENARSLKNTASILHTLLKEVDEDQTADGISRLEQSFSTTRSLISRRSTSYSRSSSTLITPADRQQVDEEGHPLSSSFRSDANYLESLRRRNSQTELQKSLSTSDLSNQLNSSASQTQETPALTPEYHRPRSNALHLAKNTLSAMTRHSASSTTSKSMDHENPVAVNGQTQQPQASTTANWFDQSNNGKKRISIGEQLRVFLEMMWFFSNLILTLLQSFPTWKKRKRSYQSDEYWFRVTSNALFFTQSPSLFYMLFRVIYRPLGWMLFGGLVEAGIEEGVNFLIEPPTILFYLRNIRELLWPNGVLLGHPVITHVNVEDLKMIIDNKIPVEVKLVLQKKRCMDSIDLLMEMLSYQAINKRLIFSLLDLIAKRLTGQG